MCLAMLMEGRVYDDSDKDCETAAISETMALMPSDCELCSSSSNNSSIDISDSSSPRHHVQDCPIAHDRHRCLRQTRELTSALHQRQIPKSQCTFRPRWRFFFFSFSHFIQFTLFLSTTFLQLYMTFAFLLFFAFPLFLFCPDLHRCCRDCSSSLTFYYFFFLANL